MTGAASCAVALVLLLDASGSIGPDEWRTQVEATASAFEEAAVTRIVERAPGGIAVMALAFSDAPLPLVPWRRLGTSEAAAGFAAALRAAPRGPAMGTNMGAALDAALDALDAAPCEAEQEVVDLSTDGEAAPEPVHAARARAAMRGARINALGVGAPEATEWLRENAVTPGGFALAAEGWADYGAAIRRKLSLELTGGELTGGDLTGGHPGSPRPAPAGPQAAPPASEGSRG